MNCTVWLMLLAVVAGAQAQSSGRFTMVRSVMAGGGATLSASSRFQLASTIAQPAASVPSSGRFSVQSGFWIWPAPVIFARTKTGDDFTFSFQTEPGKTYIVSYTDTLAVPNWQNLPSVSGDGTVKTVTNSAPGISQRFYRLVEQ